MSDRRAVGRLCDYDAMAAQTPCGTDGRRRQEGVRTWPLPSDGPSRPPASRQWSVRRWALAHGNPAKKFLIRRNFARRTARARALDSDEPPSRARRSHGGAFVLTAVVSIRWVMHCRAPVLVAAGCHRGTHVSVGNLLRLLPTRNRIMHRYCVNYNYNVSYCLSQQLGRTLRSRLATAVYLHRWAFCLRNRFSSQNKHFSQTTGTKIVNASVN
jgi:hypothetical protein